MLSKEKKEDLVIQLVLIGVTLAVSALFLVPQWKWELWLRQLQRTAEQAKAIPGELTQAQEQIVRDFMASVSRWNHDV